MGQDELERQAQELTQMVMGRATERLSSASAVFAAIKAGDVYLTFAETQWVTNGLRAGRVYFFNPEPTELPAGTDLPGGELPPRRVETDGEESIAVEVLGDWFASGRVRALRVL